MKRENDTEKIYTYCERCGKPIYNTDYEDCYAFCKVCANRLLKNIFGKEKDPQD